jgi:hypothetical protein
MKETTHRFARKGIQAAGMVWEVEIPEAAANLAEKQVRERRISFYQRWVVLST